MFQIKTVVFAFLKNYTPLRITLCFYQKILSLLIFTNSQDILKMFNFKAIALNKRTDAQILNIAPFFQFCQPFSMGSRYSAQLKASQ